MSSSAAKSHLGVATPWDISELAGGRGALVTNRGVPFEKLDPMDVISLFERRGVILFRGFGITPEKLRSLVDPYTQMYSGEVYRRSYRFGEKAVRNVDPGYIEIRLHSEGSLAPAWPEIVWFYCVEPPRSGGATTLCDGAEAWRKLSSEAKNFFRLNPIRYDLSIPIDTGKSGGKRRPWVIDAPGVGNCFMDGGRGVLELTQMRYAVTEGREGQLCFANHLIVDMESEAQLVRRVLLDGSEIPPAMMSEARAVSDSLIQEVSWQKGDLVMLDNKRFMHGRRAYSPGDPRDIVVLQTAKASFGYGVTTRVKVP